MALSLSDTKKRAPSQRLKADGEPIERKTLAEVALPHNIHDPSPAKSNSIENSLLGSPSVDQAPPTSDIPKMEFVDFKKYNTIIPKPDSELDSNQIAEIKKPGSKPDSDLDSALNAEIVLKHQISSFSQKPDSELDSDRIAEIKKPGSKPDSDQIATKKTELNIPKQAAIVKKPDSKPGSNRIAPDSKLDSELDSNRIANTSDWNEPTSGLEAFGRCSETQAKVIKNFYSLMRSNSARETTPVHGPKFSASIGLSYGSFKDAIHKLKTKKVLKTITSKKVASGYSIYAFPDCLFEYMLGLERVGQLKLDSEPDSNRIASPSNSSSSSFLMPSAFSEEPLNTNPNNSEINQTKETTTTTVVRRGEFYIPMVLQNLGVTSNQFEPLISHSLKFKDIQESIEAFAYEYEKGRVKYDSDPLNVLFGLLRRGRKFQSTSFKKEQDAVILEYDKAHALLYEEAKAKLKEKAAMEKYQSWKRTEECEDQKKLILKVLNKLDDIQLDGVLFNYYKEEVLGQNA